MRKHFIHEHNGIERFVLTKLKYMVILVGLVAFFNLSVVTSIPASAQSTSSSINLNNLLTEHNRERLNNGKQTLDLNYYLSQSAQKKAEAMLQADCWSHFCPDGKSPWEFINETGYNYTIAGENLAEGFFDIDEVVSAWMNSPTHRANMLKDDYREVGFGIAQGDFQGKGGNIIIVVHFATSTSDVVAQIQNGSLVLTNPSNGDILSSQEISLVGEAAGVDNVYVYRNERLEGSTQVDDGIFTFELSGLQEGSHVVNVEGVDLSSTPISTGNVEFFVNTGSLIELESQSTVEESRDSFFSVAPQTKNYINLAFIAILAVIFLIDFYVISHTKAMKSHKSFSHYHFAIFVVFGIVILSGGLSGHIGNGLSSV